MEKITMYKANDGSLFNTFEACQEYENNSKQKIIDDFKSLVVRKAEGLKITDEGSAFPFAEISECWWYAAIIMRGYEDYLKVKRYAKLVGNKGAIIKEIYNQEIIVAIGDGDKDDCEFNWFYWWGTVNEAIEKYKNTLLTFGK